jgi:ribosomal-protein-alanine N-acetyltransferase
MSEASSQVYIRQFEKLDLEAVVAINRSCLPENYPDQFFLGLHYHAPKAFLVILKDKKIVGYIMCRIERGISSYSRRPLKKGHIVSVAVDTEKRREGLGTELIKAGMRGMQEYGAKEFFLEVRKSNEAAISVYENLEFEIKRVLKGYYRDGEDAYLMVKQAIEQEIEVVDGE